MDKLNEVSEKVVAYRLLNDHSFGLGFRNDGDLTNAKAHANKAINMSIQLLKDTDGSIEKKIKFLENIKEELKKFNIKEEK